MILSKTMEALSSKNRRDILSLLKDQDMSVTEIAEHFSITMPSLSHHLKILKSADLVSSERQGQNIIYSLNLSVFEEVSKALYDFFRVCD